MKMNFNTIATILVTFAAIGGTYWYFFGGNSSQGSLSSSNATSTVAQQQFQTLASELQSISFNTSIFTDPRFAALVDIATPVTPEVSGRPDPFAPISGVGGK
ncbi:MAG TPA: hypothetical protein VMV50_01285 [Candidatus Paceibacterota bacterium]|nr:hypothetical protein [Candidatus Paceibacterota bacterium]